MSSVVKVHASDLKRAVSAMAPLFPKGTSSMPIGIYMSNGELKIVCVQGAVYQASVHVDDEIAIGNISVLYHDISPLIPSSGEMSLEFTPTGLSIAGYGLEAELPVSYGVVEEQDFSGYKYTDIAGSSYTEGLKNMLSMNLDKMYNTIAPIHILNGISLQRLPNVWVQARSAGLTFSAVLDVEHVKLLLRFDPKQVCTDVTGTLIFRNSTGILQLPCNRCNDESKITELMSDLGNPVKLQIGHYLEQVKQIAKVDSKSHCKITLYESGLKTTVDYERTSVSVSVGNTQSKVLQVCHFPIQVWLTFLRGLGSELVEILVGGGKICLRTQSMVIVARVLL